MVLSRLPASPQLETFIVSVRRDYFARPEENRPINAQELGFFGQPLTRKAGYWGGKNSPPQPLAGSRAHTHAHTNPRPISSCLLSFPSAFWPLLSPWFLFSPILSCYFLRVLPPLLFSLLLSSACRENQNVFSN